MRLRLQTWGLLLTSSTVGTDLVFILYGETNTGKSGEIAILRSLAGQGNYEALPLNALADEFSLVSLETVMANLPDDSGITKETTGSKLLGHLKTMISFGPVTVNPKGKNWRKIVPRCRMWFPTNDLPEIPATSNELYSRVLVIPFDVHVGTKREQKKQNFYETLIRENSLIIRRMALGGLLDYLESGDNL